MTHLPRRAGSPSYAKATDAATTVRCEITALPTRLHALVGKESVSSFARRSGLAESVLRSYLREGRMPPLDKALAMAVAAGVSVDWLATGCGPRRRGSPDLQREPLRRGSLRNTATRPCRTRADSRSGTRSRGNSGDPRTPGSRGGRSLSAGDGRERRGCGEQRRLSSVPKHLRRSPQLVNRIVLAPGLGFRGRRGW